MDVNSMINALQTRDASRRVAHSVGKNHSNGLQTSPSSTTGAGKMMAAKPSSPSASAPAAAAATSPAPNSSTITSNDFLSLLVAEMKNQDPTQPTDPNAYIQQLVGVNSLQQLIAINGELSTSGKAAAGASSGRPPSTQTHSV